MNSLHMYLTLFWAVPTPASIVPPSLPPYLPALHISLCLCLSELMVTFRSSGLEQLNFVVWFATNLPCIVYLVKRFHHFNMSIHLSWP
jgi:hypothetical protein